MICERTDEQREKQRAYQHAWAAKHRQERRASYRRYRESASGQKVRAAYTDSDAGKAAQRRYDRSAKGKRRHVRSNQQHQARYPDHIRARNAVNGAIRRGKLLRQPCVDCGSAEAEAHHEDYSRPLEVIWLCTPCHRAYHRGQGAA